MIKNGEAKEVESLSVGLGKRSSDAPVCIALSRTQNEHTDTLFIEVEAARALFRAGLVMCDALQREQK